MPRLYLVLIPLALGVLGVSAVALRSGLDEARLASSGARRDLTVEELGGARGWVAVFGCVRHDLAIGVGPSGRAYRIGAQPPETEDHDRVFTPLSAREDCDEEKPPARLFALVEDDLILASTISHVYRARVAPPPVAAIVSGVIGYGAGHGRAAARARERLVGEKIAIGDAPLLAKGKQPGVLWVAVVTAAVGGHGFLLVALGVWWALRRERRRKALLAGATSHEEEEFFRSETLE
ncbi:MAG TPA: hypothetical protein VFF06_04945 [Polyangia bacterium]|nr:hypothetical protein [Polyangia bacterium]